MMLDELARCQGAIVPSNLVKAQVGQQIDDPSQILACCRPKPE